MSDDGNPSSKTGPLISRWSRVSDAFSRARSMTLNIVALLATLLVSANILIDVKSGSYIIEPINVDFKPEAGLPDKDGIAAQLRDEIGLAWRDVFSRTVVKPIVQEADEPVFNISGTTLSLRYVATLTRQMLGFPIPRISGIMLEIPPDDEKSKGDTSTAKLVPHQVRLVLRTSSSTSGPYFDETGSYRDVIRHAATSTLARLDPFAAAGAMGQGDISDQEKALVLARTSLIAIQKLEYIAPIYRFLPLHSDVPRGFLTEANILFQMGNYEEALNLFEQADHEFKLRDLQHQGWYAAQDGLAITYMQMGDFIRAKDAIARALKENSEYDSARYHQSEIEDNIARHFFEKRNPIPTCAEAGQSFEDATMAYREFIQSHPDFHIAYTQFGIMQRLHLNWMRAPTSKDCKKLTITDDSIQSAAKTTAEALIRASILDNNDPQSSFQLANYLEESQDKRFSHSEIDSKKRKELLDDAILNYKKSLSLKLDDYMVLYRLGTTTLARADLTEEKEKQTFREQAADALCRARNVDRRDAEVAAQIETLLSTLPACPQGVRLQ